MSFHLLLVGGFACLIVFRGQYFVVLYSTSLPDLNASERAITQTPTVPEGATSEHETVRNSLRREGSAGNVRCQGGALTTFG